MSAPYEPWRCKHDKPLDVLELSNAYGGSPRAEWCMECGCARYEQLDTDADGERTYVWGKWMRPAALERWPGSPTLVCTCWDKLAPCAVHEQGGGLPRGPG